MKVLVKSICTFLCSFLLLVGVAGAGRPSGAATSDCPGAPELDCRGVPELVCKASCNQHQSLTIRDRCRYQQVLHMERYDKPKDPGQQLGKRKQLRDTRVVIEPSAAPDETGGFLVNTTVVADTDDDGNPKTRVDPKANTGLTSQAFLDLIFFPLLPEKLQFYEFEPAQAEREGERAFKFRPKQGSRGVPLAGGTVYIDARTGEVLTMEIEGMYNLEVLNKQMKDIQSISASVDYSQYIDRYRMPTLARGNGISEVSRFKGVFKFSFEESKYQPVLRLPSWAGAK